MDSTHTQEDSRAPMSILASVLFATTTSGSQITHTHSRIIFLSLREVTSRLAEHDPAFADVYYKNNIAQRTTLLSLYMAWGGTNWGHSAAPVVYTSYDYSAPLRETRQIQTKFYQTKLISLFTRVSQDLLKTYMVGNGTGYSVSWIFLDETSHD